MGISYLPQPYARWWKRSSSLTLDWKPEGFEAEALLLDKLMSSLDKAIGWAFEVARPLRVLCLVHIPPPCDAPPMLIEGVWEGKQGEVCTLRSEAVT
ncbi:hypothetical protein CYMTET_24093 [Cymbomonas tetramitiformis]|uniref:Uncharacterized protein n=1 Tax=Cymbomonas tetramitiformis TaxID=36881 RepID=A0AAE0FXE7_9CHLO|nr:hypothetical protein CYMTET_24093 [Cymbomonas tetramitiformis]